MPTDTPATTVPAPPAVAGWQRAVALAGLTLGLLALCVVVAVPLLPAITWAVALAIVAWPMNEWLARRTDRQGLAAFLSTLAVIVLIVVPGVFVAYQLARETGSAAEKMQQRQDTAVVRDTVAKAPGMGGIVDWMDRVGVNIDEQARKVIGTYAQDASTLLQGSLAGLLQFAVAVFILYHLFRDRRAMLDGARRLLPMTRAESDRVFARFADSVYANLYATVVTSLIDGVGGGLLFWAVGLPSPILWGVVMFFLSILPIVGTWLIWLPAAAYLGLTGQWPQALLLLGWGVASWFVVDNVIYVRVAGDRMRMHQVPALVAFLGGLAVFGASGMVLGPAILAVTVAVLEVWHRRATGEPEVVIATASGQVKEPAPEPAAVRGLPGLA